MGTAQKMVFNFLPSSLRHIKSYRLNEMLHLQLKFTREIRKRCALKVK